MKLDMIEISELLNDPNPVSNYTTVYCLDYTLYKIEYKNNGISLDDNICFELHCKTVKVLNSEKFYSLHEKQKMLESADNLADLKTYYLTSIMKMKT